MLARDTTDRYHMFFHTCLGDRSDLVVFHLLCVASERKKENATYILTYLRVTHILFHIYFCSLSLELLNSVFIHSVVDTTICFLHIFETIVFLHLHISFRIQPPHPLVLLCSRSFRIV
jgi:hypothetical protein